MPDHDVPLGYRLQFFDLAARTSVSHACRTFGVHRSTHYAWKRKLDRHGLEMSRDRRMFLRRLTRGSPPVVFVRAADVGWCRVGGGGSKLDRL
jgi:hypothetical protein